MESLSTLEKAHFTVTQAMTRAGEGDLYTIDLVFLGMLKRSLDILDGANILLERWNFAVAGPLLRFQLDNLLKANYLSASADAETESKALLGGKPFNKLKDFQHKPLTDARLRDYARDRFDWIDDVYEDTSKLIHFSEKHIFATIPSVDSEQQTIHPVIEVGAPHWPEERLDEYLRVLIVMTDALLQVIGAWTQVKKQTRNR